LASFVDCVIFLCLFDKDLECFEDPTPALIALMGYRCFRPIGRPSQTEGPYGVGSELPSLPIIAQRVNFLSSCQGGIQKRK